MTTWACRWALRLWLLVPVACSASEPPPTPIVPTDAALPIEHPPSPPEPNEPPPEPLGLWLYDQAGDTTEDLWGESDPELSSMVQNLLADSPMLAEAYADERLSLTLIDITQPHDLRYTLIQPDWEIFTASLSKIAVLLGVMAKVRDSGNPDLFDEVHQNANQMIKASSNKDAVFLFGWTGFPTVRDALYAHDLYDDRTGGLWWTPNANHPSSPKEGLQICGTARQIARYLLMMEQGRLLSPTHSQAIKTVLHNSALAIFFRGTRNAERGAKYYGKPGILGGSVSEGMLVEGATTRYILAVLTEGTDYENPGFRRFGEHLHQAMMHRHHSPGAE